jgi:hypothetical protein
MRAKYTVFKEVMEKNDINIMFSTSVSNYVNYNALIATYVWEDNCTNVIVDISLKNSSNLSYSSSL